MDKYHFYLDGESSLDYGIYLQNPLSFSKPSRRYSTITIPGRNGTLHIDENTFEDVTCQAKCFVLQTGAENAVGDATEWLMSGGIRRLETPEDPDVFRMCRVTEGYDTDVRLNILGVFDAVITCQPERWLKSGEDELEIESGATLFNLWRESKPLIIAICSGAGDITLNDRTVSIAEYTGEIWIDCDIQNAYSDTENKNNLITVSNGEFPVLESGENVITFSGGVTAVKIIPRWWTL